jgi:hypothetical protein
MIDLDPLRPVGLAATAATLSTYLSLFLLLLGFFVLLGAQKKPAQETPAQETPAHETTVEKAFTHEAIAQKSTGRGRDDRTSPGLTPQALTPQAPTPQATDTAGSAASTPNGSGQLVPLLVDPLSPEAFADAARGLLTEALPLVEGAVTEPGDLLAITLPSAGFSAGEDGTPRANLAPLIDQLSVLMSRRPPGQMFELVYRTGEDTVPAIARAAGFAAALAARGCPTDAVSIGVEARLGTRVRLAFRLGSVG